MRRPSSRRPRPPSLGFTGGQVLVYIAITAIITAAATWLVWRYLNPTRFEPVELSKSDQSKLDAKLAGLGLDPYDVMPNARRAGTDQFDAEGRLIPERYSELGVSRLIRLSERELNAMVAGSPDLARRFAIDLSDDLASAKLLITVDPDFPVMAGETIRVTAGLDVHYRDARPYVALRGVSIMGVPLPNAWLGDLKNVDLVSQFGGSPGFWRSFAAGIEDLRISDGELQIELKE